MDRKNIKEIAKNQFRAQKNTAVLITLVSVLLSAIIGALNAALPTIGWIISVFVLINVSLGTTIAYLKIWRGEATEVKDIFTIGFENYGRYLGGMLLMELYVFLWSLLLVIPGIIKSLSYAMTPYILREMPDISVNEAIKLSTRMMHGHKSELFVFILSFLGWQLLGGLTFGIVTVLYAAPYQNIATGGFYEEVKKDAIQRGIISPVAE